MTFIRKGRAPWPMGKFEAHFVILCVLFTTATDWVYSESTARLLHPHSAGAHVLPCLATHLLLRLWTSRCNARSRASGRMLVTILDPEVWILQKHME